MQSFFVFVSQYAVTPGFERRSNIENLCSDGVNGFSRRDFKSTKTTKNVLIKICEEFDRFPIVLYCVRV